jgi:hypothetical protein
VKVRAIANPSAAISRSTDAVAVARGQLVLGNVGLALEAFRKAQRDNPADPAVLAGIGDCYSAMGRFDLAQSNYEAALALAPHDRKLLLGLANIYEREGNTARALIARAEAAAALESRAVMTAAREPRASPVVQTPVEAAVVAPVELPQAAAAIPKPSIGSITVELPEPRPAPRLDSHAPQPSAAELDLAPAERMEVSSIPAVELAVRPKTRVELDSTPVELPSAVPANHLEARAAAELPELAFAEADVAKIVGAPAKVPREPAIVALPIESSAVELAARPAKRLEPRPLPQQAPQFEEEEYAAVAPAVTLPVPPARREPERTPPRDDRRQVAVALAPAPRLERLSRGEVALVTTGKPIWGAPKAVQMASGSTIRWVALESSRERPNVRILNAARSQGLAASARTVLFGRGWRKIAVGDAPTVLRKSVVLYPKGREALGRRLARQFGVSAQMAERDDVVLMLGRDSVDRIGG